MAMVKLLLDLYTGCPTKIYFQIVVSCNIESTKKADHNLELPRLSVSCNYTNCRILLLQFGLLIKSRLLVTKTTFKSSCYSHVLRDTLYNIKYTLDCFHVVNLFHSFIGSTVYKKKWRKNLQRYIFKKKVSWF